MSFCKKEGQKQPPVSGNFQFRSGEKETAAPKNDTAERDRKWNQYTRREREWGKAIRMRKSTVLECGQKITVPTKERHGKKREQDYFLGVPGFLPP